MRKITKIGIVAAVAIWSFGCGGGPSASTVDGGDGKRDGGPQTNPGLDVGFSLAVPFAGWGRVAAHDLPGKEIGTLFFNRDNKDFATCDAWAKRVIEGRMLPDRIDYQTAELGGIPVFELSSATPGRLFTGDARYFAVTLGSRVQKVDCKPDAGQADCAPMGDPVSIAGTSRVLNRSDLFCLEKSADDPACLGIGQPLLYWWGRHTSHPSVSTEDPWAVRIEPFAEIVAAADPFTSGFYEPFSIFLDLFAWNTEAAASGPALGERRQATCVLRLFDLPDDGQLTAFEPMPALAPAPDFPRVKDRCIYEEPFNPFVNQDLVSHTAGYSADQYHGLPNTFVDATAGWDCPCDGGLCDERSCDTTSGRVALLPRIQLVSSRFESRFHPVELFCNDNVETCKQLDQPEESAKFNAQFGLPQGSTFADQIITKRLRTSGDDAVPWGEVDGSGDRGLWRKVRLKAGFETSVIIIIRNEGETSYKDAKGQIYDTVVCNPERGEGRVRWVYPDSNGAQQRTDWVGIPCRPCNYHAEDGLLPHPYRGTHATNCPALYGIEEDEGIRFKLPVQTPLPLEADGPGYLEFSAVLTARGEGASPIEIHVVRHFPLFFDGVHPDFLSHPSGQEASATVETREACWIGATNWAPAKGQGVREMTVLPNGYYHYRDLFLDDDRELLALDDGLRQERQSQFRAVGDWLMGGDANSWFKKKIGNQSRLLTLAGDVSYRYNTLDWFQYRGSTISFYHHRDEAGQPVWVTAEQGLAEGTACPAMKPVLLDNGYPWAMERSTGQNRFNGISHLSGGEDPYVYVDHCQETRRETSAPMQGFQFRDQEQRGDAYIWFFVGADWGWVSPFAGADEGNEIKKRFDLMSLQTLAVARYQYDRQRVPWGSFIGFWDEQNGIDDLGRSVSWSCLEDSNGNGNCDHEDRPTTFVNTVPIVVADLGEVLEIDNASFIDPPAAFDKEQLHSSEGLLVWHAGCYRCSDLYLSFVTRAEVLHKERYWHFAGLSLSSPGAPPGTTWSLDEADAVPVIWDNFGEFSVVNLREKNNSATCSEKTVFQDFMVIYPLVEHRGIVMREAKKPWGPYSDFIPLYGNTGNQTSFNDLVAAELGKKPIAAYGGYTHPDLWGQTLCDPLGNPESTLIRYNVSVWIPYKSVLVETRVSRPAPGG